jgi:hypothetical protein
MSMTTFARTFRLLAVAGIASLAAGLAMAQSSEAPGNTAPGRSGETEQPAAAVNAADPNSEWPCEQPLRPELSTGAMWSGPDPKGAKDWREVAAVAALVNDIAPRRTPQDQAIASIGRFAAGYHGGERKEVLTELFAGTFDTLNAERNAIIAGIKHFYRRQDALAKRIEDGWKVLGDLDPNSTDPSVVEQRTNLQQQVDWDSRIFDERQRLLHAVCDQPQVLEQRVFALSRAIQEQMAAQ